jgi:Spy/CpxP family protein refolding chaperone
MTTTVKRFAIGLVTHVMVLGLGAGVYAVSQDELPNRFGRPFLNQRGGPGSGGPFGGRGGPGGPIGALGLPPMVAERLNLTDAQKQQITSIVESRRDEVRTLADRGRTAREALEEAVTARTFDEATVRSRSAELAAVEVDMAVTRARIFAEVVQILTPEQRTQLDTLRAEMQQMRQTRQERRAGPR